MTSSKNIFGGNTGSNITVATSLLTEISTNISCCNSKQLWVGDEEYTTKWKSLGNEKTLLTKTC